MANAAKPVDIGTGSGSAIATAHGAVLSGFTALEATGGSPATVVVRDGDDASGDLVAAISLNQGEARTLTLDVLCRGGIYVERSSGTTHVSVHMRKAPVLRRGGRP